MPARNTVTYPPPPAGPVSQNTAQWMSWFILLTPAQRTAFLRDGYYPAETIAAIDACFGSHGDHVRRMRNSLRTLGYAAESFARAPPPAFRHQHIEHVPALQAGVSYGECRCPQCPATTWRPQASRIGSSFAGRIASRNVDLRVRSVIVNRVHNRESLEEISQRLVDATGRPGQLYSISEIATTHTPSQISRHRRSSLAIESNSADATQSDNGSAANPPMSRSQARPSTQSAAQEPPRAIPQQPARSRRMSHNDRQRRIQLVDDLLRSVPASWTPQTSDRVDLDNDGLPALRPGDGNLIHSMRREVASEVQEILHG